MGSGFYSLRTTILLHLVVLILSAMLLINVVMLKLVERHLLEERLRMGRVLVNSIAQMVGQSIGKTKGIMDSTTLFASALDLKSMAKDSEFHDIMVCGPRGQELFFIGAWGKEGQRCLTISRYVISTADWSFELSGRTWGVIWFAPKYLIVSAPVQKGGLIMGAVTIRSHLRDIYERLRDSERIILLYIALNGIVLLAFGGYLLSRTVLQPINKLLKITEEFHLKDTFSLPPEPLHNEMGQLYRSLNMMLKRLNEHRKELETHIKKLEHTNQELKKAQEEIIRSEKLASVGRLATGIAHEIGNPIGIVLGYLDLLKRQDLDKDEARDSLERMETEISRINTIIRELLDFARPMDGEKGPVGVNRLIQDTVEMMRPHPMMKGIRIITQLEATKDTVLATPNQLKQVFINILMNAADAINEFSGDSGNKGLGQVGLITIVTRDDTRNIEITFRDNGKGIAQEDLPHIFDPFFTTKEPGKGTGLGLSVSYSIVESLGGSMGARSGAPGAEITVRLPILRDRGSDGEEVSPSHR